MSQGFWLARRLAASEPWELSLELGRKQTVLGLKRKGMGFSFQAISNWEALAGNNSLNSYVLYYFPRIRPEQKHYPQTSWVCILRD